MFLFLFVESNRKLSKLVLNKTEHAVHSHAAGKGEIYHYAEDAEQSWAMKMLINAVEAQKIWDIPNPPGGVS